MRLAKLISIILLFALYSCDGVQDNVIDPSSDAFLLENLECPVLLINTSDSIPLLVKAHFSGADAINEVWFRLKLADGSLTIEDKIVMKDNGLANQSGDEFKGDGVYSALYNMTKDEPRGNYIVEVYIRNSDEQNKKVGVKTFEYLNNADNFAPVISDLSAPDTVIVQDPKSVIVMSVKVTDENSLNDIKSVYFTVIPPGSSTAGPKFYLLDSGIISENGDEVKGDGIYSIIIEVTPANTKGLYQFNFEAEDRSGTISNTITHNMVLR